MKGAPAATTTGDGTLELLVFFAVLGWVVWQFTRRRVRWQRRWFEWYMPFLKLVASDARAVWNSAAAPIRRRRAVRGVDFDAEWSNLSRGHD